MAEYEEPTNEELQDEARESEGLIDFLLEHPQENVTATIRLSKRFTDRGFKFEIKALTFGELEEYRKEARAVGNRKTGEMNTKRFNELIVLNHLIKPNLKDINVLRRAGVNTSEAFLYKFFNPGEISELVNQITTLSGYDADEESAIEEVKG
jgi:hypothetical protein